MTTETPAGTEVVVHSVSMGVVSANRPAELVKVATEAANALAAVIKDRKLFSEIQGKKFVRCEGWTTLAAMMGVTPYEVSVEEPNDGTFVATVELRRLVDGQAISRASSECGKDEPTWAKRPRYARRSMALTRATAKACRLAFSWVMALSGYEVTPAEEIPHDDAPAKPRTSITPSTSPTAAELSATPEGLVTPEADPFAPKAAGDFIMPIGRAGFKGKPLKELPSANLLATKEWCATAKMPEKFIELCDKIDEVLLSRGGE